MTALAMVVVAMTSPTPTIGPPCREACGHRVKQRTLRSMRAREMARYRRHPMPRCTWHGESGAHRPEWSPARYRARNPVSSAGGKFQILDSTWLAFGGPRGRSGHPAADAAPVVQERVARRVLAGQGLRAWVLC